MLGPRPVRRLVAVTASIGVAAALTAGISSGASATTEGTDETAAPAATPTADVREARPGGSFVVRGSGASAEGLDPALMADLRAYAASSGERLGDLVAEHRGVDELAAALDGLERRSPDTYVTGGLASAGDGALPWVQFTTRPSAAQLADLRALPTDVRVTYGAPASFAELERLSSDLVDAADEQGLGAAIAGYDPAAQVMELTYAGAAASAEGRSALGRLTTEVAEALPGDKLPLPVVGASGAEGLRTMTTVTGGREVANNRGACTAGFTAVRRGKRGVLTSGHCPDFLRYQDKPGILKKAVRSSKARIDLQWHGTRTGNGHKTVARFRERAGKPDRIVRKVANAPRGSVICKYGRTSHYSCSRIRTTNICANFTNGKKYCALDVTRRAISRPGDSGGPNFLGTTARGITTGGTNRFSVLTRISRVDAIKGTKVMKKKVARKKRRRG